MSQEIGNGIKRTQKKLRTRHERGEFTVSALARRLGCSIGAIRYVLSGSEPRVTIALALERELGIPVADLATADFTDASERHTLRRKE